jgi:hypothetical protein
MGKFLKKLGRAIAKPFEKAAHAVTGKKKKRVRVIASTVVAQADAKHEIVAEVGLSRPHPMIPTPPHHLSLCFAKVDDDQVIIDPSTVKECSGDAHKFVPMAVVIVVMNEARYDNAQVCSACGRCAF